MNGAEVFRFATRVMVTSAEELLAACGATVEDVDLYVPHQANKRIVDHAVKNLGLDPEKVLVTSTASATRPRPPSRSASPRPTRPGGSSRGRACS